MRRTKVVVTLGPARSSPEVMRELAQAGMDVARLNFSHGAHEDHAQHIAQLRAISNSASPTASIGFLLASSGAPRMFAR